MQNKINSLKNECQILWVQVSHQILLVMCNQGDELNQKTTLGKGLPFLQQHQEEAHQEESVSLQV